MAVLSSGLQHSDNTSFPISLPITASRSRRDGPDSPRRPACSDGSRPRKRSQRAEPGPSPDSGRTRPKTRGSRRPGPAPKGRPLGIPLPASRPGPPRASTKDRASRRQPAAEPACPARAAMLSRVLSREGGAGRPRNNPGNHRPRGRPSHSPLAARGTRAALRWRCGRSAAIEASVDEGPRRQGAAARTKEAPMPRRRTAPDNTQAMWEFCRHCGSPFPPEGSAVRGRGGARPIAFAREGRPQDAV